MIVNVNLIHTITTTYEVDMDEKEYINLFKDKHPDEFLDKKGIVVDEFEDDEIEILNVTKKF
jgi:hypothetical protein